MKLKSCFISICLVFTASKAEDLIIDVFQSLIQKKPICQSLVPEMHRSGNAVNFVDVHLLSRFLKELAKYPCLVFAEDLPNQTLLNELFPQAEVYQVSADEHIDSLVNQVQLFAAAHGGYAAVLTQLPSRPDVTRQVQERIPQLCYLSIDGLFDQATGNAYLDMPKLLKLMKRRIHIVCTAALIPIRYNQRKNQYIRSLNVLRRYGYDPYVVESCVAGPTFLDEHCNNVCYTLSNDAQLRNKGVNESVSLLMALEKWQFKDDDIILKLTGRYLLQSDALLRFLENNEDVVALAKYAKENYSTVLTGCFAMRCDLMKKMYASFDYDWMEREMICVEHEVGPHLDELEKFGFKLVRAEHLGVEANVFGESGMDGIVYW